MNKQHTINKNILVKAGFTIHQFVNSSHRMILVASHKDGRKVNIVV